MNKTEPGRGTSFRVSAQCGLGERASVLLALSVIAMMTGELHLGVHGVPGPQWVMENGAQDCVLEMALLDPSSGEQACYATSGSLDRRA